MSIQNQIVTVESCLGNRYKHVRSENIDELISFMGYGFGHRWKLQRSATVFLVKNFNCFHCTYDKYKFIEICSSKTTFTDGQTSCCPSYTLSNGWESKRMYIEGNRMVKVQSGNKQVVTVWEFYENELVMTISVDNVVRAKKFYERTHDSMSGAYVCCQRWYID